MKALGLIFDFKIPFIYASSAATYGNGNLGYNDDHLEVPKLRPMNPYGFSKQIFDEWAIRQTETPPKWFGLKFFNVFGPNEYHKDDMRSMVHKAYYQIREQSKVRLFKSYDENFKDGEQLRDFIYVKDVVKALVQIWKDNNAKQSGIYNLGTGKARSFNDLARSIFNAMNVPIDIEYFEMPDNIRDQYQYFTESNSSKLKSLIGDIEFNSLENSINDYVNNYLINEDQYF